MTYQEAVHEGRCRRFLQAMNETAHAKTPVCGKPVAGSAAGWMGSEYCAGCLSRLIVRLTSRARPGRKG
jgi:hypothetical protein